MVNASKSIGTVAVALLLAACGSESGSDAQSGGAGNVGVSGGAGVGVSGGAGGGPKGGAGGLAAGGAGSGTGGQSSPGGGGQTLGGNAGAAGLGSGGRSMGGTAGNGTGGAGAGAAGGTPTGGGGGTSAGGSSGSTGGSDGVGGSSDVCPAAGVQACYYVAPNGSAQASGSIDDPFQTVTDARDAVRGVNTSMTGDIYVYLRGGDYRITSTISFGPEDSGTNAHRIYYRAYPGETPVLNGATKVTGWAQHDGNIYQASLDRSTKLRNLYVNDTRASMSSKRVNSLGGYGTYSVSQGQASWAWTSGSGSDGIKYSANDIPAIANNQDDLEIVNGTTWNENIACVRAVETTSDNNRGLLLQQPYGAIAQLPGWNAGFSVTGTHTVLNAYEFLSSAGQFFFDKTTGTLYYIPRGGEDMASADVEAPVVERLVDIAGTSRTNRVSNLTLQGITFANTDYSLYQIDDSHGKASVQGATVFVAYGDGDWHASKYEIVDTFPAMVNVDSADGIELVSNVFKHSGNEGIGMHNDVINSKIIGNYITDIAGSGITIGHPQHVYIGDGGAHEKYSADVEGICANDTIDDNFIYDVSTAPGFGGHSGVTAFYTDTLAITHNQIESTAYNGLNLGWGWKNYPDSTTAKDNTVSFNRFINIMTRLHDSGAVYTIGQNPGTEINQNYVRGIPPNTSGPTYGLHNDEGSAYITENDNVLDIDPGVTYTINCEDFGDKHDLTILRTYATVNKMGANPPSSQIDTPIVVSDAVWPVTQYGYCLNSGVQAEYQSIIPREVLSLPDYVFPASVEVPGGTASLDIRSSGDAGNTVWFAPAGTSNFAQGANMTEAAGDATSIAVPDTAGTYKLFVVDSQGQKTGESEAQLRVSGG